MCLSLMPPLCSPLCPPQALPCPSAHYYFIVWFCIPSTEAEVEGRPLALLLTHVGRSLPQREETKQREEIANGGPGMRTLPTLN